VRLKTTLALAFALIVGFALSYLLSESGPLPAPDKKTEAARSQEHAPRRGVILFAPNLEESAYALGYGKEILATTDYCVWPPSLLNLPKVGGALDPKLEKILSLTPDLLVVQGESRVLSRFAKEHSIPLARVDMDRGLNSILEGFCTLDSILARRVRPDADRLRVRVQNELDRIEDRADSVFKSSPRPKVLLSLGHDPVALNRLWTVGSKSFLGELLTLAGGVPLYADSPLGYFEPSLESVLADPPDLVLELRPEEKWSQKRADELAAIWHEGGVSCPVELVTFDGLLIPGPRIAQTARAFQDAIIRARGN
jgi:ABC-type Fe3+-hydroxamate transport system substrate-binding protein